MSQWLSYRKVAGGLLVAALVSIPLLWVSESTGLAADFQGRLVLAASSEAAAANIAPDFELSDINGTLIRLSQFKGDRPVLLYFWATWCPYCLAAKPQIAKLRDSIGEKEMEILGINVGQGDSLEKLKRFQAEHPSNYPILYDQGSRVSEAYRVQGIPLFVLIDKDGQTVYRSNDVPKDPKGYLK